MRNVIKLTLTETDAFRRLVTFLETIEAHADEHCDLALKDLVEDSAQRPRGTVQRIKVLVVMEGIDVSVITDEAAPASVPSLWPGAHGGTATPRPKDAA